MQSVKTLVHTPFSRVELKWFQAPKDLAKEELSSGYIFLELVVHKHFCKQISHL